MGEVLRRLQPAVRLLGRHESEFPWPLALADAVGAEVDQDTQRGFVQDTPGYRVVIVVTNPAIRKVNSSDEGKAKSVDRTTADISIKQLRVGK